MPKWNPDDYHHRIPLGHLANFALESNLVQLINFKTWTRVVRGTRKQSLLDHVYVNNKVTVTDVN